MKRLSGTQLEALTLELDTPSHRFMASAVGGVGTVTGIGIAGVREMKRHDFLQLNHQRALRFGLMTAAVGTAGGAAGHYLLVRVARGPMTRRALICGTSVGLTTALAAWGLTFYGRKVWSPFEPSPDVDRLLRTKLKTACVVGPAAGMLVSLAVIEALKIAFYPRTSSKTIGKRRGALGDGDQR
jgi:hypothetical protein